MVTALKHNGTFLLNCTWETAEELEANLPPRYLKAIAEKEIKFYVIDAFKIAKSVGMAKRTNTVMQVAFFHLSKVIPPEQAIDLLK